GGRVGMRGRIPGGGGQGREAPSAAAPQGPRDRGGGLSPDELWSTSAGRLADLIRSREISSEEAVEACLARIAAVNPGINAVVAFAGDAVDRARDVDARLARGEATGPLHGVPFTIKDSIDT